MTCTVRGPGCASCCCCAWLIVLTDCEITLPLTPLTAVSWGDAGSLEGVGGRAGRVGSDLGASSQSGTICCCLVTDMRISDMQLVHLGCFFILTTAQ